MSNNDRPLYGLIDLGGTKLLSLIVNAPGDIIGEDLRPSNTEEGLDSTVQRIGLSLDSALAGAGFGREQLRSVGVASPGAINFEAGVVSEAPQLPGWQDVPLRDILRELLGLEVMLENDANAAAVGEHVYGAGRGSRHMLYLTISTGIGGGIIIDGRLYRGKSGAAGELGHIVLDMNGPLCGCGARGCVESLASGTAIAREAQQLIAAGQAPVLSRLAQEEGEVTAETVYKAALEGEEISGRLLKQAGVYLGTALAS
ncbi:MAG TPA: ROK family protein, partial [Dehalococcoidia bacterium]|nr:ROK family protein [Dehalococcoidia bacterium]